ncbi:hypothetical protein H8356DRAFT_1323334 [Neocallimastix lanati (nom. inval.)]|nr:hypothetical protein H8356DRAFT_1323334 [Neocallimastix sp. JGI-2020a]
MLKIIGASQQFLNPIRKEIQLLEEEPSYGYFFNLKNLPKYHIYSSILVVSPWASLHKAPGSNPPYGFFPGGAASNPGGAASKTLLGFPQRGKLFPLYIIIDTKQIEYILLNCDLSDNNEVDRELILNSMVNTSKIHSHQKYSYQSAKAENSVKSSSRDNFAFIKRKCLTTSIFSLLLRGEGAETKDRVLGNIEHFNVLTSISVLIQDPNHDVPLFIEIRMSINVTFPLFVMKAKDYNMLESHSSSSSSSDDTYSLDNSNLKDELSLFNPVLMSTSQKLNSKNKNNVISIDKSMINKKYNSNTNNDSYNSHSSSNNSIKTKSNNDNHNNYYNYSRRKKIIEKDENIIDDNLIKNINNISNINYINNNTSFDIYNNIINNINILGNFDSSEHEVKNKVEINKNDKKKESFKSIKINNNNSDDDNNNIDSNSSDNNSSYSVDHFPEIIIITSLSKLKNKKKLNLKKHSSHNSTISSDSNSSERFIRSLEPSPILRKYTPLTYLSRIHTSFSSSSLTVSKKIIQVIFIKNLIFENER